MKTRHMASLLLLAVFLCQAPLRASAQEKNKSKDRERFSGVYELSPGMFAYIQPMQGAGEKLAYYDDAGQIRELSPLSENIFSAGRGLYLPTPVELKITFIRNSKGRVTGMILHRNGLSDTTARKVALYRREEVRFRDAEIALAGTLLIPSGKGRHPAIVLTHGTGPEDRNNVLPLVHFLVPHGIAILGYDKRGVGESTGDWRSASLENLADDAVAAVQYLKSRNDIDPYRIGVLGASQGGWVAPLAASKSASIAFVISVSGPGITPAELTSERLEHDLRTKGFSENEIADALALMKLRDDFARGKESWETLQAAAEKSKGMKWFQYVPMPPTKENYLNDHWPRILDYDPEPVLESLHVPVLALFGALDDRVFPQQNSDKWREALRKGGNKDYTIKIFPSANHMLLKAKTGEMDEYPSLTHFIPGYAPLLLNWLRDRGIASK